MEERSSNEAGWGRGLGRGEGMGSYWSIGGESKGQERLGEWDKKTGEMR